MDRLLRFDGEISVGLAPESHQVADPGPCCANHFRQGPLTYLCNHTFRPASFAEVGQQQEDSIQPLLAGFEQLHFSPRDQGSISERGPHRHHQI